MGAQQPLPQLRVDALQLLDRPGRDSRPRRLALLLRGLPGSGKSHVARLVREREVAAGGQPPRILSLDDYFVTVSKGRACLGGWLGGLAGGLRRGWRRTGQANCSQLSSRHLRLQAVLPAGGVGR